MSDRSKIEWCDASLNPFPGCSEVVLQDGTVSPACADCYASRAAARMATNPKSPRYHGLAVFQPGGQPRWTGKIGYVPSEIDKLPAWDRPRRIFLESMGDIAHEDLPMPWWLSLWDAMVEAVVHRGVPHWIYLLSKRPGQLERQLHEAHRRTPTEVYWRLMKRVVVMTTIENQKIADEEDRLRDLRRCPAVHYGVSAEPLVGPLSLRLSGEHAFVNWVICGGQSGPKAVPMHPQWARDLRDACAATGATGTRFFFKQWGEWAPVCEVHCTDPSGAIADAGVGHLPLVALEPSGHIPQEENGPWGSWCDYQAAPGSIWMARLGKRRAGRTLDGQIWNQHPGDQEAPWNGQDSGPAEVDRG